MKKIDLLQDTSTVSTIPIFTIKNIFRKLQLCMVHDALENYRDNETSLSFEIGIGSILMNITDDGVQWKFIPSNLLEKTLEKAITEDESPLITSAEDKITQRIRNAYKDLL